MTKREEILLKEYSEACEAHRGIEQLSRTGLTILLTALGAVIGFVQFPISAVATDPLSFLGMQNALIELFGVVVSYGTSFMILRSQLLSRAYMGRIKGIEETLGMQLYISGGESLREKDKIACPKIRKELGKLLKKGNPGCWRRSISENLLKDFSNKDALALMARTPGHIFVGLLIVQTVVSVKLMDL